MIATALVAAVGAAVCQWPSTVSVARPDTASTQFRWQGAIAGDQQTRRCLSALAAGVWRAGDAANGKGKEDRLSRWACRLAERSHPNVACLALANKTARMAWAMLRNGTDYRPDLAAA